MIDRVAQRGDVLVVPVRHAQVNPFQFADRVIQYFPVNVIKHVKGSVFIDIHCDREIQDLIRRIGQDRDRRNAGEEQQNTRKISVWPHFKIFH